MSDKGYLVEIQDIRNFPAVTRQPHHPSTCKPEKATKGAIKKTSPNFPSEEGIIGDLLGKRNT